MGKLVVVISQICKWHGRGGVLGLKHKKAKLYTGSRTLMNIRKCFVLSTIPISSTFHNSSSLWVCLRCQARRKKWSIVDWAFLNFLLPAAPKLFQKQLSNGFVLLEQFLLEDLFRFQMSHSLVLHCCSPPPSSEWKTVNFGFLPGACIICGSLGKGIVCCLEWMPFTLHFSETQTLWLLNTDHHGMLFQLFPAGEDPCQPNAPIGQRLQQGRWGVRQKGLEDPDNDQSCNYKGHHLKKHWGLCEEWW